MKTTPLRWIAPAAALAVLRVGGLSWRLTAWRRPAAGAMVPARA